jgi:Mor family transcriptional regulator
MSPDTRDLELLLPTEYPGLWRDMAAAIYLRLRSGGEIPGDPRAHARLAMALAETVAEAIGGDTIYIPVGHFFHNDTRSRALIADCTPGTNLAEVARRHGYTPARAKQILRDWAREDFQARQGHLSLD